MSKKKNDAVECHRVYMVPVRKDGGAGVAMMLALTNGRCIAGTLLSRDESERLIEKLLDALDASEDEIAEDEAEGACDRLN